MAGNEPIIESLLDTDFYKDTMANVVHQKYRDTPVRYGLTNRTKGLRLADRYSAEQLTEQLDYTRSLRFNPSELAYKRGIDVYGDRMFNEGYLQDLKTLQLPDYELGYAPDGEFQLEFPGTWFKTIFWETMALSIMIELNTISYLRQMSPFEQQCVFADGVKRLEGKIKILKTRPDITFIEFGTRRRALRFWQDFVIQTLQAELSPEQFKGTSNTLFAYKYGLTPMGTCAHEMYMIMMGIMNGSVLDAHNQVMKDWWEQYGFGLSVALTDTFGTEFFLKNFTEEQAVNWKGFRQDSGDPFVFGEKVIAFYEAFGIDPRSKLIIFSDGLDLELIIQLADYFKGRINVSFGWGTNLTNDLGLPPISLVIKAIWANNWWLVKLSDNPAKSIGPRDSVQEVIRQTGHIAGKSIQPVY
jgi:nicotinate phosphoribosyltransferase